MITLHHLNNSRSQRILWLLEELGLEYEIRKYQRDKKTMLAPPELKQIHPLGKAPIITDGNQTLAESGAIIEYLVNKYGKGRLKPVEESPESLRYTYWLHYAEGSAMPPLLLSLIFNKIESSPAPFFVKPIIKQVCHKVRTIFIKPSLKTHFDFIESELEKYPWFAGNEFTAADIQMSFPMEGAAARGGVLGPKSQEFLARIHARPAYQQALKQGGDFHLQT